MSLYEKLIRPALFRLPAETAHELGLGSLRIGLATGFARRLVAGRFECPNFGRLSRFGLSFKNPLGMAAGFDKDGRVAGQLAALGFGFVEIGTLTYRPQKGNPAPRLFRLAADRALINRLGFNNEGTARAVERLRADPPGCVLGVNIGKNKDVPNERAVENYLESFDLAHGVADYIAVNVSSPNTPGLRQLQQSAELERLLVALQTRNRELAGEKAPKPLLIKIAPDLVDEEIEAITDICRRLEIAGIIATNTTIGRENLSAGRDLLERIGPGGLSGRPLAALSDEVIRKIHRYSRGKLPVIGVGGIFTARDAFAKIAAGACLLQAYTGFVYRGPAFAREINAGLAAILKEKGFENLDQAVGCGEKI